MKSNNAHYPPRWAERLLEWYCRKNLLEDLQGDLQEYFERNLAAKGARKARIIYVLDVLKFMRPYTIRKLEIFDNLIQTSMFKNYFKTSIRSIARNRLFSAINVIGLAISMSVCLLMISFLAEIFSYDSFHENRNRLYRAMTVNQYLEYDPSGFASTSILAGKRIQEEVPGVETAVIMTNGFGGDATMGDKIIPISGFWAGEEFFEVFPSFQLLKGDATTALSQPNTVVVTQEAATKLFGSEEPMGQVFKLGEESYTITGVMADIPHNSHMQFESLGSFITFENSAQEGENNYWNTWENIWSNYVYFQLAENASIADVSANMRRISEDENSRLERSKNWIEPQAMMSIMPGPQLSNAMGRSMDTTILWILSGLTLVVMLSAAFNYTNLSIARSLRRAKEVGVRKVVGAKRKQIFTQFVVEAMIISMISLVFAFLLYYALRPQFLNLDGEIQRMARLLTTPTLVAYFVVFTLFVGLMAGFFPAVFLSKMRAIAVLKDAGSTRLFKKINMRKVLIVVQFTLSMAFIISANIAYKQYKYSLAFDLGFQTENVLNVRLQGNDAQQLANIFSQIPEVTEISKSGLIPSVGSRWGNNMKFEDPMDSTTMYRNVIDENYIPLMNHELLAGSNFEARPLQEEEESIIVNEQTLKRFSIGTPNEAIGKMVSIGSGSDPLRLRIIGVVKDFHYATIDSRIETFGFRYIPDGYRYLNLKINSNDILGTMSKLESAWQEFDQVHEFEAEFYDERIEQAYAEFSMIFKIVGFLAFLAISIAALGLLGMAVYTAETRLKEISIRKVLGATEGNLIQLLARGFMWLLIISALIAVPVTFFLFDSVILAESVNRISIGAMELFLGVIVIFVIGFLTIGSQTLRAAKTNPAETLRAE